MNLRLASRQVRTAMVAVGLVVGAGAAVAATDAQGRSTPQGVYHTSDAETARVLRELARWANANGYHGLSPVSLTPIEP